MITPNTRRPTVPNDRKKRSKRIRSGVINVLLLAEYYYYYIVKVLEKFARDAKKKKSRFLLVPSKSGAKNNPGRGGALEKKI